MESTVSLQHAAIQDAVKKKLLEHNDRRDILRSGEVQAILQTAFNELKVARYVVILADQGQLQSGVAEGSAALTLATDEADFQHLLKLPSWKQFLTVVLGSGIYRSTARFPTGFGSQTKDTFIEIVVGIDGRQLRNHLLNVLLINVLLLTLATLATVFSILKSERAQLALLESLSRQLERLEKGEQLIQQDNVYLPKAITNRLSTLARKLAGEQSRLKQERDRLTQIMDRMEERLMLLSPDLRVILMSPKFDHLIGLAGIDLVGTKLDEILSPSHPLIELIERACNTRTSTEQIMQLELEGKQRQLLASVRHVEDKTTTIGMLVSLRDFDSFKQFQSHLAYSEKLAALGRITSGVAHEVKNPLNAMVIHLEILRSKLSQTDADVTPQLEILSSEIKRLDRVVQTFLNFTRPVQVNLRPLDLNDLVHQVTRLAAMDAETHEIKIVEDLSPDFLRVNADADLLKQTLLNIILNGCQAMPEGGILEVKTSSRDNLVEIAITDHGEGIPPEARDKIFNLFYTTKPNGNGIGLAQAFYAVQLNNGHIEFESEVGIGTTFRIMLPKL
ncbi:MAG: ATP-binding protein [Acidobacteriota bacterium]|nr:ATP-binding protein [Blastocatellia bacterium]MDW8412285.1 ATP-binding protein [Acidobacteriota bacterium]